MAIKKFSWELIEESTLVKNLDYSSFYEHATAIPQDFYHFFNLTIQGEENLQLLLMINHLSFNATIKTKLNPYKRKYVSWESDFSNYLKEAFLDWENIRAGEKTSSMKLAFIKTNNLNTYQILISPTKKDINKNSEILKIERRNDINETEKFRLIKSRIGQGVYRNNLIKVANGCRVTGLANSDYLIASHIKPWACSNDKEKLDGNNGLLLSPHIDKLFDQGYISFSNDGKILISEKISPNVISKWCINNKLNVGKFNNLQQLYLEYHRANIFKR